MTFAQFRLFIGSQVEEWRNLHIADLQFWHRSEAWLSMLGLTALVVLLLVARSAVGRLPGRHQLMTPSVLGVRSSHLALLRHIPLVLFLVGLPFFAIALADPFTALVSEEVTFPGRRIGLMIDASTSMRMPFKAGTLNQRSETDATFFTTVAAAERFVRMRMESRNRDLIGLVEFGNEAYVVTPFTNDYENILLSISLIGDPVEYSMFPDQGTILAKAIDESIGLFKAFNYLDAVGNIMVLFSDGEDTMAIINGRTLDEIVRSAVDAKIPLYFVRTNYGKEKGNVIPDQMWAPAVEKTGGRFYAADTEQHLIDAIKDIDSVASGTIRARQYTTQQPRFSVFALLAAACWLSAATLKLAVPQFQKLP